MASGDLFREIVRDTAVLVKQTARRGALDVSPEVAAWLQSAAAPVAPIEPAPLPPPPVVEKTPAPLPATAQSMEESDPAFTALEEIAVDVRQCTKCTLSTMRKNTVFGVGNRHADLVFVGEAPGAEEDRQGLPFVGRAGQLLTDIIEKGIGIRREEVYICNVLKCRPPENRDPNPEEVRQCEPYLLQQLAIIRPKVICALGRIAAQTLLKSTASTGQLRGHWHNYHGIPLRVTYHPAYLLRNPADKRKTWDDIQEVMKVMNGQVTPDLPPSGQGLF